MSRFEIDLNKVYVLTNDWSGPQKALGSPSSREVTMVDLSNVNDTSRWRFVETSRPGHYRLHTVAGGLSRTLDVINDNGTDSRHVHLTATGNYSGQFWKLDTWDDGTVRLSNTFTGDEKHLDVYANTFGPHLGTGDCIGQHWTLTAADPPRPRRRVGVVASDLVQDLQLATEVIDEVTYHTYTVSRPEEGRRQIHVNERWRKQRDLSTNPASGVFVEICALGPQEGKLRAIKRIQKAESLDDPISYSRELEAIATFSHSRYKHCFVEIYGWWETPEALFVAAEYVERGSLEGYLTTSFSEPESREIVSQLLEGIQFMHGHGFAHKDFKPQNILVFRDRPSWWVKISEFGINELIAHDINLQELASEPGYLAPESIGILPIAELVLPSREPHPLAGDIWALGMLTFRLLAGVGAFAEGRDVSPYVILGNRFPNGPLLEKGVSPAGIEFVEKALTASSRQRPTAKELSDLAWIPSQ